MTDAEFREAYARHKDVLFRFAWRMSGSAAAAEDLVQDCFLLLWRNPAAYHPERGTLGGFLIGVTRNLAQKRLRKERSYDELKMRVRSAARSIRRGASAGRWWRRRWPPFRLCSGRR